jgi:hypothetical protein
MSRIFRDELLAIGWVPTAKWSMTTDPRVAAPVQGPNVVGSGGVPCVLPEPRPQQSVDEGDQFSEV